ncbi:hypothetical protein AT15_00430 [Kosmotoga arenicorallina S304]|uniref:Polymerase nucleotidyl transferase domain-containing protein n=1 Tax=Kosmotoga arenicorallina S304 TaxID=1453497 RepID=A0A176K0N2_9BACT|nr:nucleotidyltransferase domain-containing protein [Kosmotoga arenicorallina]OAA30201.1 hypothetical protein AT15_00430 [Kosmotoga arenicorallina S304]
MVDYMRMAELFVDHIKREYPEDISIVAYYGSYARGTQNPNSDFDLFFIPATERGFELADCVILDGIGIDFFSISWKRAERIANFDENIVSVIADCKLLYARSKEDKERLESLQEIIQLYQTPEKRKAMLDKAERVFSDTYRNLYFLRKSKGISEQRTEVFHALTSILQSIALINQTYLKSGWGKNFKEIFSLPLKPEELEKLVYQAIYARSKEEMLEAIEKLCSRTAELLEKEMEKFRSKNSFESVFKDFYEELRSTFLKIETACDNNQPETAFCAAATLQDEVKYCLGEIGNRKVIERFSELEPLRAYDPLNLKALKSAAARYEKELLELLGENNVPITRMDNLEEYRNYLNQRKYLNK